MSFDIVAQNGNNVEATFDVVERIVRLVAFDNVAGVDGALGAFSVLSGNIVNCL